MLIRRGVMLDGAVVDIRVGEQIDAVGESLGPRSGEYVLDAGLGAVLPGLHDHHLHLRAAAAALDSLSVGPPTVRTKEQLAQVLTNTPPGSDGWIRAVGYHESVAGELDRVALDALVPHTPVRIQHRSGALWILNSAALARVGLPDHPDGRVPSADHGWTDALQRRGTDLAELSRRLTAFGVTGVTDATPDLTADDIVSLVVAHRRGEFRPTVRFLAPAKMILHDDRLDLDALTDWIIDHRLANRPVAVHCVTAAQLVVTIAALRAAGTDPLDRIEHAAIVPYDNMVDLKELAVTVVTQPNFVSERGSQYLKDVPVDEQPYLWRIASLMATGIPVAGSTDAPFGAVDPWAAMRAAVNRTTGTGEVLGADERIAPRQALNLFLGQPDRPAQPRTVEVGQPGDLCVLTVPPADALTELASDMVAATVIGGEVVYTAV
jgi:predicted amidohydrolase YtcJ